MMSSKALAKAEAEYVPSEVLALGLATSTAAENGGGGGVSIEKEHMFDKVVTPSDVGKLNRLVIPKQHAEKYLPLDTASASEKGLHLNFEDRNGKHWRFRYSYWNSSQSYVMTKGWSRFVKDKKLDPGDVVSFHRAKDRLFIDYSRRPHDYYDPYHQIHNQQHHHHCYNHSDHHQSRPLSDYQYRSSSISAPLFVQNHHHHDHQSMAGPAAMRDHSFFFQQNFAINNNYSYSYGSSAGSGPYGGGGGMYDPLGMNPSLIYLKTEAVQQQQIRGGISGTSSDDQQVKRIVLFDSVRPVVQGNYDNQVDQSKRLRLFGVNIEYCARSSSSSTTTMINDATAVGSDDHQPTDDHLSLSNYKTY